MFTVEQRDAVREYLLRLAEADEHVVAGAAVGSLTVDGGDRFSDLDLSFGIADHVPVAEVLNAWTRTLIDQLDAVHLADLQRGPTTYRVFLFPDALQVDLSMTPAAQFRPAGPRFRLLFGATAAAEPEASTPYVGDLFISTPSVAEDLFGWGVIYALHARACIERGRLWQAEHYVGKPASSGLLQAVWQVSGDEFAELAWMARIGPPGTPGTPPAPRHRLWVVGACVPGAVVGTAVLLGTVAAGAVVVGTPAGAVVVAVGPDGDVVEVPGVRVAGGVDRSPPATTTPTEVLPSCRGWVPTKLARGWLATASTPVMAATAIPKASTAPTATRCQRIGWGWASFAPSSLAPSSLASAWSPTRRRRERRATLWADVSEWVYTASAGATSRLTSAAPIRVPSTPNKDAMTAPLTAASAPASNLGTRSCSISHLEVRVGHGGAVVGAPWARPDPNPAAAWRAPP